MTGENTYTHSPEIEHHSPRRCFYPVVRHSFSFSKPATFSGMQVTPLVVFVLYSASPELYTQLTAQHKFQKQNYEKVSKTEGGP